MRRLAPVFALMLLFGIAACEGSGGGTTDGQNGGQDTNGGTDQGGGGDTTDPCAGLAICTVDVCTADKTAVQFCATDANGCLVLGAPQACDAGQACLDGACAACTPDCTDKECGSDGCTGDCGTCGAGETCVEATGTCEACVPNCTGKSCGDDGCGGQCAPGCGAGQICNAQFQCEGTCTPDCTGKECGSDGCTGTCGTCGAGESCTAAGQCEATVCVPNCTDRECGNDGCGDSCGFCPAGENCVNGQCQGCVTDCTGRDCGPDGCGGSCGSCEENESCTAGDCIACTPDCTGRECGGDGCGGSCGPCDAGESCADGQCVACTPSCDGKNCGDDGCGGVCGTCNAGLSCLGGTCVCVPDCTGAVCGDNGCGGSCGTCSANEACTDGACVACTPDCTGKECGTDGCSGNCGPCDAGESCVEGQCQGGCVADCDGKDCGDDGCSGTCGSCDAGEVCTTAGNCRAPLTGGCEDYFTCAGDCEDEACRQDCIDAMTATGQTRLNNLSSCLSTRCQGPCFESNDAEACTTCAVEECTEYYGQCFFLGGTDSCPDFYTCATGCEGNLTCLQGCYDDMSPAGYADYQHWVNCLFGNCATCAVENPSPADETACTECMNTVAGGVCNSEALECFGEEPEGESCVSYFTCAQGCAQGDTACLDACEATLAPQSASYLNAYMSCLATNCADCTDDECLNACTIEECAAPYANCVYETGTDSCNDFYGCLQACGQDDTCVDGCFDAVSAEGWLAAVNWENCIGDECPTCATDPNGAACDTCFNTVTADGGACFAQTDACFGGGTCTPDCTGRECGSDGCGGSCPPGCGEGEVCQGGQCIEGDCSNTGFTIVDQMAAVSAANAFLEYDAIDAEAEPFNQLVIELYQDAQFGGPTEPGTYQLTGAELNYGTCGLCVRLFKGVANQSAERQFFPTAGTVDIDSIGAAGATFSGTVTGLQMVEVTINPQTFQSTPVPGGETWCVDSVAFEAVLEDGDAGK